MQVNGFLIVKVKVQDEHFKRGGMKGERRVSDRKQVCAWTGVGVVVGGGGSRYRRDKEIRSRKSRRTVYTPERNLLEKKD